MNAMILAAGLGTRLAPLTDNCPKALVPVGGRPLIEYTIESLAKAGVTTLVINVHHFGDMLIDYVEKNKSRWPSMNIVISDERDMLLDTGGGLLNATFLFPDESPIIVSNADVLCDIDYRWLYEYHKRSENAATLVTSERNSTRQLLFDEVTGALVGWRNKITGELKLTSTTVDTWRTHESAFCGIHVISNHILRYWLPVRRFSLIDGYLSAAVNHKICEIGLPVGNSWFDIGTTDKLARAEEYLANRKK